MTLITIPEELRQRLGEGGAEALMQVMERMEEGLKDTVLAVAESRFERRIGELREEMSKLRVDIENKISELRIDMENKISELRADMENKISDLRTDMENKIGELRVDMQREIGELRTDIENKIGDLRVDMEGRVGGLRADIVRWMFIFWVGQMSVIVGIVMLLLRR